MTTKIDLKWNKPVPAIINEALGGDKTLLFAAASWHRLYAQFVPMDTGTLANQVEYVARGDEGIIIHKVPYAAAVYYGKQKHFSRNKHSLAQAFWDRGAIQAGESNKLAKDVQAFIKGGG